MKSNLARLRELERQHGDSAVLILLVDDRPTPAQQVEIDTAIQTGRVMVVHVKCGDTLWIADADIPPPWLDEGGGHAYP